MYATMVILRITPLIHSSLTFETGVLDSHYSNRIAGKPLFSLTYILPKHLITLPLQILKPKPLASVKTKGI